VVERREEGAHMSRARGSPPSAREAPCRRHFTPDPASMGQDRTRCLEERRCPTGPRHEQRCSRIPGETVGWRVEVVP
jgi:hypothetical protein